MEYQNVLDLIDQISAVNLSEAYISVESEKVDDLIKFLKENNVQASPTQWNSPESLYIGEGQTASKQLTVLAISF